MEQPIEKTLHELKEINRIYNAFISQGVNILGFLLDGIDKIDLKDILEPTIKDNTLLYKFIDKNYIVSIIPPIIDNRTQERLAKGKLVTSLVDILDVKNNKEIQELQFSFNNVGLLFSGESRMGYDIPEEFIYDYIEKFKNYVMESNKRVTTTIP